MKFKQLLQLYFMVFVAVTSFGDDISSSKIVGSYYQGAGLGVNCTLTLHKDGSFHYTWDGCLGNYDALQGKFELNGEQIVLNPSKPSDNFCGIKGGALLSVIPWDKRIYLVPKSQMMEFVNEINSGLEPRKYSLGSFYFKRGDEKRSARNFPKMDPEWAQFILKKPVFGKVLQLPDTNQVLVNLGSNQGLKPGMMLYAAGGSGPSLRTAFLEIISISADQSISKITDKYNTSKIGDCVSSRFGFECQDGVATFK
jgi:hypothetical protein